MKNITLIGMPGSGKSTVGVLLAKVLGYNFLDVDLLIQQREGALLQEILNERGTERFLDTEAEAICSVECPAPTVIAPGGSAVCRAQAMEHLKALGTVVYLRLSYGDLEGRIHNLGSRGIAMEPGQTLRDIYDYRAPLYEAYADRVADVGGSTLEQALAAVLRTLVAGE